MKKEIVKLQTAKEMGYDNYIYDINDKEILSYLALENFDYIDMNEFETALHFAKKEEAMFMITDRFYDNLGDMLEIGRVKLLFENKELVVYKWVVL